MTMTSVSTTTTGSARLDTLHVSDDYDAVMERLDEITPVRSTMTLIAAQHRRVVVDAERCGRRDRPDGHVVPQGRPLGVTLTVTDDDCATDTDKVTVTVTRRRA